MFKKMRSGYLKLFENGELQNRIEILKNNYNECILCPHKCRVNRNNGEKGICRTGPLPVIASYNCHFGEEPPISGTSGSGTIFFSGCSGRCVFCQNYPISQLGTGKALTEEQLSDIMLKLQNRGCNNINLVTPTHFLPSIIAAISVGASKGLYIPIVYNTGGYERAEIIKLLDGIIDIFLPDAKYGKNEIAKKLSGFTNYIDYNHSALIEMYKQVGNLQINDGIAEKGIIIRHLILPGNLGGTDIIMKFISENISKDIYISLMDQYFPAYKAFKHKILSRRITSEEYNNALEYFHGSGLYNGWIQNHISAT